MEINLDKTVKMLDDITMRINSSLMHIDFRSLWAGIIKQTLMFVILLQLYNKIETYCMFFGMLDFMHDRLIIMILFL